MEKVQKSTAVVFSESAKVELREIDLPALGPEDVVVKVEYSSISIGTERWALLGKLREPGQPPMTPFPHIAGYQAAGVVVEIGDKVTAVAPGDRVFSVGTLAANWPGSCWGGHSRYHLANQAGVIKLPDAVSTHTASGLVLAQVGYNGARRPRLSAGDPVLVIGDGLVGQYAAQVFRHRGAHVILAGHRPDRLALATQYSADEVFNSRDVDISTYVKERYPDGVAISVESAGKISLVQTAIKLLKYEGQFVLLGYYPEGECLLDIHWVRACETTVYCPNSLENGRLVATLDLIAKGAIKVDELVTHTLPYTEAPAAYRMILEQPSGFLGVVLKWD